MLLSTICVRLIGLLIFEDGYQIKLIRIILHLKIIICDPTRDECIAKTIHCFDEFILYTGFNTKACNCSIHLNILLLRLYRSVLLLDKLKKTTEKVVSLLYYLFILCCQWFVHPTDDHYHFAFDLQRFTLLDEDGLHGWVGRLKTIAIFFLEEVFQCRFVITR